MRGTASFALATLASVTEAGMVANVTEYAKLGEVVVGFFQELAYLNRLDSIENCAPYSEETLEDIARAYELAASEGWGLYLFEALIQIAKDMIPFVWNCKGAPEDIKAMVDWLENTVTDRQSIVDITSARSLIHTQEIEIAMQGVWDQFTSLYIDLN